MVNIYKIKLTNLQQEILRLLYIKAGIQLNARNIAKTLGVSQPAVSKALPYLEKENFIKIKKDMESKRLSIELNRDNHYMIWLKRVDNIKQIYESGLVQFIYDNYHSATIILFGSFAFGEDTINSDIDVAVIGSKENNIDLSVFDKILDRKVVIHHYKNFKDIDPYLLNNICNGIILKGSIEI